MSFFLSIDDRFNALRKVSKKVFSEKSKWKLFWLFRKSSVTPLTLVLIGIHPEAMASINTAPKPSFLVGNKKKFEHIRKSFTLLFFPRTIFNFPSFFNFSINWEFFFEISFVIICFWSNYIDKKVLFLMNIVYQIKNPIYSLSV